VAQTQLKHRQDDELIKKLGALEKQLDSIIKIIELLNEFVEKCCQSNHQTEEQKVAR